MDARCRIRALAAGDAPAVARLERALFTDPWSEGSLGAILDLGTTVALGSFSATAGDDEVLTGYCIARVAGGAAEILDLAVTESQRHQGLATSLLSAALDRAHSQGASEVFLEVRESNSAGRGLYRSLGFRVVGVRAAYYRSPTEDALILRRSLPLVA